VSSLRNSLFEIIPMCV